MPKLTDRVLLASAAQSADGSGAAVDLGVDTSADLDLIVSAVSGSLAVIVETSKSSSVGWETVAHLAGDDSQPLAFGTISAPGIQSVTFTGLSRYLRVRWTLSGTATFSVSGKSVRVYATPLDLESLGLHKKQLAAISWRKRDSAIREITDKVDSAVALNYETPLETWGDDVRGGVSACAAVSLMAIDGLRLGQDDRVAKRCTDFDKWLDLVADGKRRPAGAVDQTPDIDDGGAFAVSDEKRGW